MLLALVAVAAWALVGALDPTLTLVETLAKAGPTAILVWGIVLLLTGRLVPGKEHARVLAERDRFLELALKNATVASRALDHVGAPGVE